MSCGEAAVREKTDMRRRVASASGRVSSFIKFLRLLVTPVSPIGRQSAKPSDRIMM